MSGSGNSGKRPPKPPRSLLLQAQDRAERRAHLRQQAYYTVAAVVVTAGWVALFIMTTKGS